MNRQYDSSLIPRPREHDEHYEYQQCINCAEELNADEIEAEREMGDCLCRKCRNHGLIAE